MAKRHYVSKISDLGHLPRKLHFLDSNVLIDAAYSCEKSCVRIVESDLKCGYTSGVKKEVRRVLNDGYKGIGLGYIKKMMEKDNFSEIKLSGKGGLVPRELSRALSIPDISYTDKNLICLLWAGTFNGLDFRLISSDHHLVKNRSLNALLRSFYFDPSQRIYYPERFCKEFDSELEPFTIKRKIRTKFRRVKNYLLGKFLR